MTVCNFRNKVGITIIFFAKWTIFNVFSGNRTRKSEKVLVFEITAFDPGSINSHNLEEDTSHWQSISYQGTLIVKTSLREVYSKAGSLRVMKNIMKVLSSRFYKSLGPFNMFTFKGCSQTVFFREWSNQVFDCNFRKTVGMTIIFFL